MTFILRIVRRRLCPPATRNTEARETQAHQQCGGGFGNNLYGTRAGKARRDRSATRGTDNVAAEGTDTDSDGLCDTGDPDDDNDTVADGDDRAPIDTTI